MYYYVCNDQKVTLDDTQLILSSFFFFFFVYGRFSFYRNVHSPSNVTFDAYFVRLLIGNVYTFHGNVYTFHGSGHLHPLPHKKN